MRILNIHEAKTHLSQLVESALQGKETIIAKAGKPVAKLTPIKNKIPRRPGVLKDKIRISNDFDHALPEQILKDFEE